MSRSAAVVLAAGLGTRFGGSKLLARLDGRPLLQHVLDLVAGSEIEPVVVVLGAGAGQLRRAISWRGEEVLLNPQPERGLAGSLQLGLSRLAEVAPRAERALVLLGDQPRLSRQQLDALLKVSRDDARPMVVPRYADHRPGNPVLLERSAWPLAARLTGDRGMSQLFESQLQLVRYVDVPGANPDVDTPADLAALEAQRPPGSA